MKWGLIIIVAILAVGVVSSIREWQLRDYYEECYQYKEPIIATYYNFTCYDLTWYRTESNKYEGYPVRYSNQRANYTDLLRESKIGGCVMVYPYITYEIVSNRTCEKYHLVRRAN